MSPTARTLASTLLGRIAQDNAYSHVLLNSALSAATHLNDADRRLVTELVYGVLRQQLRLDHVLSQLAHKPLSTMPPLMLDILRVAAYQLCFLQRIPAYAAVNEAVRQIRKRLGAKMAAVANGILRKVSAELLDTNLPTDPIARLSITSSLPATLMRLWIDRLGDHDADALAASLLQRPALGLRVNVCRAANVEAVIAALQAEGARIVRRAVLSPHALYVDGLGDLRQSLSFQNGWWTVQDEAAQVAVDWLDPQPGEFVLDGCAGIGGKTTQIAIAARNQATVWAVDPNASKLALLTEHCARLGVTCQILVQQLQAMTVSQLPRAADRILIDAPCSGLGVIRRHPELKWRWDPQRLPQLVSLQRALITAAHRLLKVGGVLVYSVCTMTTEETALQIQWIAETFADLRPDRAPLQIWPHQHDTDGFFVARFIKI